MTRRKPQVATFSEKLRMMELLEAHSTAAGSSMSRLWSAGWNFKRIAQEVRPEFTEAHSRRVAEELGWTIHAEPAPSTALSREVEALRKRVETLETMVGVGLQRIYMLPPGSVDVRNEEKQDANTDPDQAAHYPGA
jgi:hypothetical protein